MLVSGQNLSDISYANFKIGLLQNLPDLKIILNYGLLISV